MRFQERSGGSDGSPWLGVGCLEVIIWVIVVQEGNEM